MKALFSTPQAILTEINKMQLAEKNRREDRAEVARFFNGQPPLTQAEAEELGITVNVNHLFGYTDINRAKEQMFGMFTKPSSLFDVEMAVAPPGKREDWSRKARAGATRVLNKVSSFIPQYEGCSGDAALHGQAVFFNADRTFPLPRQMPLSRLLVPDDSGCDPSEITHFAMEAEMSPKQLMRYHNRPAPGWNQGAVSRALKWIYDGVQAKEPQSRAIDPNNYEELEYYRQQLNAGEERRKPGIDVLFFYQQRCDKAGEPWELTILFDPVRSNVPVSDGAGSNEKWKDCVLYTDPERFMNVREFLHPYFMDCIIGGEPKWHRVLGLGHLNYQLNWSMELMLSRVQQGALEGAMNIWKVTDSSAREEIQQLMLRHNGVIPEGVDLVPNRFEPNFQTQMQLIQFLRQQGGRNSTGSTPNVGDPNDMLQVQFLADQNQGAEMSNVRAAKWYRYGDVMWTEVWRRLTNPMIDVNDCGYSIIMDFQSEMEREGVPLWFLQPENCEIKAVRIVGDGLRSKELGIVTHLMQTRAQHAPEVQGKIMKLVDTLVLDNPRKAEELNPSTGEEGQPTSQTIRAETENSIMTTQRQALKPLADDVDEVHVIVHFPAMERLLQDAAQYQNGAFTPQQFEAFRAIGGHIVVHVNRIEERAQATKHDEGRERARMLMDTLNKYARMGQKMANNMQQMQQAQGQQPDPMEVARLQLDIEKTKLAREKQDFAKQKFFMQQNLRERQFEMSAQNTAFDQMLAMSGEYRADREEKRSGASDDVRLALEVKESRKPEPATA